MGLEHHRKRIRLPPKAWLVRKSIDPQGAHGPAGEGKREEKRKRKGGRNKGRELLGVNQERK